MLAEFSQTIVVLAQTTNGVSMGSLGREIMTTTAPKRPISAKEINRIADAVLSMGHDWDDDSKGKLCCACLSRTLTFR